MDLCFDVQQKLQGGPSGRGMQFVDIKLKVPPEYKFLILNAIQHVNNNLSATRWASL